MGINHGRIEIQVSCVAFQRVNVVRRAFKQQLSDAVTKVHSFHDVSFLVGFCELIKKQTHVEKSTGVC